MYTYNQILFVPMTCYFRFCKVEKLNSKLEAPLHGSGNE